MSIYFVASIGCSISNICSIVKATLVKFTGCCFMISTISITIVSYGSHHLILLLDQVLFNGHFLQILNRRHTAFSTMFSSCRNIALISRTCSFITERNLGSFYHHEFCKQFYVFGSTRQVYRPCILEHVPVICLHYR